MSKRATRGRRPAGMVPTRRTPSPALTTPAAPTLKAGSFDDLLERAQREVLIVSLHAPDGLPEGASATVIRLKGQRVGVEGRSNSRDQFVREESIAGLPPDSGPFSITTRVADINPGEWQVTGEMVQRPSHRAAGPRRGVPGKPIPLSLAEWSWRTRRLRSADDGTIHTAPEVFTSRPGVVPGAWAVIVALAVFSALVLQASLASRHGLARGATLATSILAVVAGGIGAKVWFLILERGRRRWEGWAIQGFVVALIAVAGVAAPLFGLHLGLFLDVTAPALLLGMGIGRIGCFYSGCCGGRPTCSRHGIWSSDRRIGTRRIPTQLFESALAFALASGSYALISATKPRLEGTVFVLAVSLYTLCRQVILRYRAEARHTSTGTWFTAVAATLAVAGATAAMVLG